MKATRISTEDNKFGMGVVAHIEAGFVEKHYSSWRIRYRFASGMEAFSTTFETKEKAEAALKQLFAE